MGSSVPARFEEGGVYVTLKTTSGASLTLYTDTGGGGLVVSTAAARRLGLPIPAVALADRPGTAEEATQIDSPNLAAGLPQLPAKAVLLPKAVQVAGWPEQADGFLGVLVCPWVWTWDYPQRQFIHQPTGWHPGRDGYVAPLYFKVETDGSRSTNFPRINVDVAGTELPMLLDPRAETYLTVEAAAAIGGEHRLRATRMLAGSIFDRLRAEHPDWKLVRAAQEITRSDMLEVHDLRIAGLRVGPVWFTRRSDASFHEFMSSMMDARVEGALGANALAGLRMTLDYGQSVSAFSRGGTGAPPCQ